MVVPKVLSFLTKVSYFFPHKRLTSQNFLKYQVSTVCFILTSPPLDGFFYRRGILRLYRGEAVGNRVRKSTSNRGYSRGDLVWNTRKVISFLSLILLILIQKIPSIPVSRFRKVYQEKITLPWVKTVRDTKSLCICTYMDYISKLHKNRYK